MIALLLCTVMVLADDRGLKITLTGSGAEAAVNDDYTYDLNTGEYEIMKSGDYTISTKAGVLITSDVISTNADDGPVNLTLDNVTIKREGTDVNFADGPLTCRGVKTLTTH